VSELDAAAVALARSTVERAAPEEIPIFPAASEAYLEGGKAHDPGGQDMLGFGIETAVILLTPIAITVARDVLGYLRDQVTQLASDKGKQGVDSLIARLTGEKGHEGEEDPEPLTEEQLEEVRELAVEKAKQLKLDDDRAALLADSLVGSLATA